MKNVWIRKAKEDKEKQMNDSLRKTFEKAVKDLYGEEMKLIDFKQKKN